MTHGTWVDRFWSYVDKQDDECWHWTGALSHGYGTYRSAPDGWSGRATRIAYRLETGKQATQHLLHSCDNKQCVNPEHLKEGSRSENMKGLNRKFSDAEETEIRREYTETDISQHALAEKYGCSQGLIFRIVSD